MLLLRKISIFKFTMDKYNIKMQNSSTHKWLACLTLNQLAFMCWFIYLFGVLRRFQHCTGHITTVSWKGRGNQYIQFVRVLYCKLLTNGKQLPAFRLEAVRGIAFMCWNPLHDTMFVTVNVCPITFKIHIQVLFELSI